MTKVELFEAIRRDSILHGKSVRQIARERGLHRRMVREALACATPRPRKAPDREPTVLTQELKGVVDQWLLEDSNAPRKQRHTARRIWQRLRNEHAFTGAESTLRRYVGLRRRQMGRSGEVFVPLLHPPGAEAEVDWYEFDVDFPDGRQTVQGFLMRACFSGREFHIAFPRQTQRAFIEAHVAAIHHFGAVFHTLRYDNLTAAVKKVLKGRRREETDAFVTLRSHYLFSSEFCRPGVQGAHEKGGVEGAVGRFRRSHLTPVPRVDDFDALNRLLLDACAQDDMRRIEGKTRTVLEDWNSDLTAMRPLPPEPLATAEVGTARVDAKGCAQVRTNRYSVPVELAQREVEYRLHARRIEFVHGGRVVATHPRMQQRHQLRLELDHYLELLWYKPGALSRSLPLHQARQRGQWPPSYDTLRQRLALSFDEVEATRQLLTVLMLHRQYTPPEVHAAVELALELGSIDAGAISVLVRQSVVVEPAQALTDLGELQHYDRPVGDLSAYDQLLGRLSTMAVH